MMGNKTNYGKLNKVLFNLREQLKSLESSHQTMIDVSPVAGNLILARSLYLRAESNAEVVKSEPSIPSEEKTKMLSEYQGFLGHISVYEKKTYQNWLNDAYNFEEHYLRNKNRLMFFHQNKLVSGFNKELFRFMDAVRRLKLLNYDVPKDLMILVERRYHIYFNKLQINKLVGLYNEFVNKISEDAPVLLVMESWYYKIKSELQPGLEEKNSLVTMQLPKCIENSFHCLKQIDSILSIIKSYEKGISENLELIENLTFFPTDFYEESIQEFSKTFDKFNARINGNAAVITGAMTYIAQGINLIEHTCFGTATGCHKDMYLYYEKYKNALFDAFIGMVIKNYNTLKKLLDENRVAFVVGGNLINNHFAFDPNILKIADRFTAAIDDIPNQLKSVPRWLRKTNLRCFANQRVETMETYLPHSFYDHVTDQLPVKESRDACFGSLEKFCDMLENQSEKFKKFEFLTCKQDELVIRRFIDTRPNLTLDDYKEKIGFFISLSKMIQEYKYIDLGCVRLNNTELIDKLTEQCQYWTSIYSKNLISQCKDIVTTFSKRVEALEERLNTHVRNGQDIFIVNKAIEEIKKTNVDADITFQDINNKFHYLMKHSIVIPEEQFSKFENVKANWQHLHIEALGKYFCIEDAKKRIPKSNKNDE